MRFHPSLLALCALVLVTPLADAQSKLGKGKGGDAQGGGQSSPPPKKGNDTGGGQTNPTRKDPPPVKSTEVLQRTPSQRVEPPKRTESRSGVVDYRSRNNKPPQRDERRESRDDRVKRDERNHRENRDVNRAPGSNDAKVIRGSMRQPQTRPNYNSHRDGYVQYDHRWNDDRFCYPHYSFNYSSGAYLSPWFNYSNLPGYIRPDRCDNSITIRFGWGLGVRYTWGADRYDNSYRDHDWRLDQAIDDISDAFSRRDAWELNGLLPRGGRVMMDVDGRSSYSLSSDDFADLMRDVIEATQTESYVIVDAYRHGNEATVVADHTFRDAWGGLCTQRHWYGLRRYSSRYEIVSFRSSR